MGCPLSVPAVPPSLLSQFQKLLYTLRSYPVAFSLFRVRCIKLRSILPCVMVFRPLLLLSAGASVAVGRPFRTRVHIRALPEPYLRRPRRVRWCRVHPHGIDRLSLGSLPHRLLSCHVSFAADSASWAVRQYCDYEEDVAI